MKQTMFAALIGLLTLVSCSKRTYSDSELQALLIGPWATTTAFETTEDDTHIVLKSSGKVTFNADGSMVSEGDSSMTITVPDGELPVEYSSVVHGQWTVDEGMLRMTRTSEEITARDEISRKFIEHEGMLKLRAESPTEFVYSFKHVSPQRIVTLDSDGSKITYTRTE